MAESSFSCREIFAMLSEFIDAELPPEACEDIARHIEGCAPCVEFVESLRKTIDLCRQYQPNEVPPPIKEEARNELMGAFRRMRAGAA
jgi:hypothetical protein